MLHAVLLFWDYMIGFGWETKQNIMYYLMKILSLVFRQFTSTRPKKVNKLWEIMIYKNATWDTVLSFLRWINLLCSSPIVCTLKIMLSPLLLNHGSYTSYFCQDISYLLCIMYQTYERNWHIRIILQVRRSSFQISLFPIYACCKLFLGVSPSSHPIMPLCFSFLSRSCLYVSLSWYSKDWTYIHYRATFNFLVK